jgi:rod shape-determining protein MreB
VVLRGRDARTGFSRAIQVSSVELRSATDGPVGAIAAAVRDVLDETPPELLADVRARGILLTGGSALLRGLPQRLSAETGIAAHVAATPATAVLRGLGRLVGTLDDPTYRPVLEFSRAVRPALQAAA